jgi:hypothetical protein
MCWTFLELSIYILLSRHFQRQRVQQGDHPMAQKKHERKKELDRRRKRRDERLKQRVKEARAAKA